MVAGINAYLCRSIQVGFARTFGLRVRFLRTLDDSVFAIATKHSGAKPTALDVARLQIVCDQTLVRIKLSRIHGLSRRLACDPNANEYSLILCLHFFPREVESNAATALHRMLNPRRWEQACLDARDASRWMRGLRPEFCSRMNNCSCWDCILSRTEGLPP